MAGRDYTAFLSGDITNPNIYIKPVPGNAICGLSRQNMLISD